MMKADIYYFSGTGNSLVVAKDIKDRLNGNLISIPTIIDQKIIESFAEIVGIIFPVYYADICGIPLIVERFIEKFSGKNQKYLFAVCTHKGAPGTTIENLKNRLIYVL